MSPLVKCSLVLLVILIFALAAEYPGRYLDFDKPGGMYFCASHHDCGDSTGTIVCDTLCPTSRYTYCAWDLQEWDCFARMPFNLEIINASVQCSKYPYGNWVKIDSCRLSYNVTTTTRHSWMQTTYAAEFWFLAPTVLSGLAYLTLLWGRS